MNKFILVGGMPRSGTTLLETVVGSNSRIAMPPGDYPFAEQYARNLSVEKIFSILSTKATWDLWAEKDFTSLYNKSHGEAFRESMLRYAASMGKDIPSAKSPFTEFFYADYRSWLAEYDLKFVHVVRNPFDVIASLKKSHIHTNWQNFTDLITVQASNWQRSASMGLARQFRDPDHYMVVRYEDFAGEPEKYGKKLCEFLGVEFEEDRMLNRADYAYHDTNTSFPDSEKEKPQDSAYIYAPKSRKSFLDPSEIELIGRHCGEIARSLGYEDTDFKILPPAYAEKMEPSIRLRRKITRLVRRLFGRSR